MAITNYERAIIAVNRARLQLVAGATHNFAANGLPTVNDDETKGFGVGSLWFGPEHIGIQRCTSAAAGAATWQPVEFATPDEYTITGALVGATPELTVNWANGACQLFDLANVASGAALTIDFTGTPDGGTGELILIQRGATAATVVFDGPVWVDGDAPVMPTGDDAEAFFSFRYAHGRVIGAALLDVQ